MEGRADLRDLVTFTIDPETAEDFDDALSVRQEEDGIRAWVHIADVSYFVPAGSPLDRGAEGRAFSTYVPGRVAPMLPHELADDLCSLRPHVDRLTVTVEFPPNGEPLFYRSVIRSHARLTYAQAERGEAEPDVAEALRLLGSSRRSCASVASGAARCASRARRSSSPSTGAAASSAPGARASPARTCSWRS